MKQNHMPFLLLCAMVFLASPEAGAQSSTDGQPSVLKEDKGQSNYVYDLKLLIKKSKDNIKGVNEKIKEQAVIKRNQQREEKAREYYEQALKLHEEGRLEEARQLFDKAIRITEHPEMKYYIKESERRSKLQKAALQREETDQERRANEDQRLLVERAEDSYQMAVTLYKQQKFREAKDEFMVVEELYPDYKAVRSYLQIVEQDIIQSEHLNMKEQNKEIDRQQKEEEIARLREKELWRKEVDKKEQERQKQLRVQAQGVYEEALKLFDERKYTAARDKFQEVEWVVPDFKATRAYLTRIENGIREEKKELTKERQRELEKQRWQDVLSEKKSAEERRKVLEQREQQELLQVKDQAEFIYVAAVALFEKDLLEQSREKFNEVNALYPKYKSTLDYLKRIDQVLLEKTQREAMKKKTAEERRIWEEEMTRRKEEKQKFKLLASEADIAYQDAMALYQTGRLIEAKEKFLEVDQRVPDYKSTRSYLKRIDQDIELSVKTNRLQDSLARQREEVEKMRMMRDKAEEVYTQAMRLYEAKDFSAAKEKFLEAAAVYPDYKRTAFYLKRIDTDIRSQQETREYTAREKEAAAIYGEAVVAYQMGEFEEAKKKFLSVETVLSNYKQTEDFLGRIDDDILKKKESDLMRMKEDRVKVLYDQAVVLFQNGDLAEAKEKLFEVEVVYPGYKDASAILESIDAELKKQGKEVVERQEAQTAEKLYEEALALYQAGDYAGAKQKFIKTEVARSDYKDCLQYLERIDADIARKEKEEDLRTKAERAEPLYAEAVALYKNADFMEAKKKFLAAQVFVDNYKETSLYLARIDRDIRDQEERLAKEEKMRTSDLLYSEAVKLYMYHRFVEAKEKFLELAAIDPAYKNVRGYLSRINDDIRQESEQQVRLLVEQQVLAPYLQGITLYHDGDLNAAKEKFSEVVQLIPDYKKARFYLSRINEDLRARQGTKDKEREAKAEALYKEAALLMGDDKILEAYTKFCDVELVYPDYKAVSINMERLRKLGAEKGIDLPEPPVAVPVLSAEEEELAAIYKEAVGLYKDQRYDDARVKFEAVGARRSGYRSTQEYIDSINELKDIEVKKQETKARAEARAAAEQEVMERVNAREEAQAKVRETRKTEVKRAEVRKVEEKRVVVKKAEVKKPEVKKPEEDKFEEKKVPVYSKAEGLSSREEAQAIAKLSARSSAIYQQIKSLSEDKQLSDASRTFAKVDRLIENLDAEHRRMLEQVAREKKADEIQGRQAKLAKEREDLRKKESEGLESLKDQARENQQKAEDLYQQALTCYREKDYDTAHASLMELSKIAPEYKDAARLFTRVERAQDEARVMAEEVQDRDAIKVLADKAMSVNLEILELSRKKDYAAVEERFNDLESILKGIQVVKGRIVDRRGEFELRWEKRSMERNAGPKKRIPARVVKEGEDFIPVKDKARALFKEGQQLYGLENFAEARVKFTDALELDPAFKAPLSYVRRIDRILLKRDFEVRQAEEKARAMAGAGKDAGAEDTTDLQRAADVSREGVALYQAKRYREARIKFEELLQIGSAADQQKASRYLALVEQGLEKEKKGAETEQRAQKERYLEEQRAQAKLDWDLKKKQEQRELRKTKELIATQRELDIRRQQELRTIEDQNLKQRREMLEAKSRELAKALRDGERERAKFSGPAVEKDVPVNVKAEEEIARQEQSQAKRLEEQTRPAAVDDVEVPVEQAPAVSDKLSDKEREQAEIIRRNQQEVEAILKGAVVAPAPKPVVVPAAKVIPPSPSAIDEEDPTTLLLQQAAEQERQGLEEQRALIRKDFEEGVDRLYNEAVTLFKKKMYDEAREDFQQVDALIKGYKRTAQYLKEIERNLSRSGR